MSARDLFEELLPRLDDEDASALAWGLLQDWFGALRCRHSERCGSEILDSLNWEAMPQFVQLASLHMQDWVVDFEEFAAGVRTQARLARVRGLVVPDGAPRVRRGDELTLDLFEDEEMSHG